MVSDPRAPRKSPARQGPAPVPAVPAPPILSWIVDAACADADPETFSAATPEAEAEAKATCARCPVRPQCRDYALATAQEWGVWGGLSEAERSAVLDPEQEEPQATPPPGGSARRRRVRPHSRHEIAAVSMTRAGTATLSIREFADALARDPDGTFTGEDGELFLRVALERVVILVETAPGHMAFEHRTLQDFYLGQAIAQDVTIIGSFPPGDLGEPLAFAAGLAADPVLVIKTAYERHGVSAAALCCNDPHLIVDGGYTAW